MKNMSRRPHGNKNCKDFLKTADIRKSSAICPFSAQRSFVRHCFLLLLCLSVPLLFSGCARAENRIAAETKGAPAAYSEEAAKRPAPGTPEKGQNAQSGPDPAKESAAPEKSAVRITPHGPLSEEVTAFCGDYFLAGNYRYTLNISPYYTGDAAEKFCLFVSVLAALPFSEENPQGYRTLLSASVPYETGRETYVLSRPDGDFYAPGIFENVSDFTLSFFEDGSAELSYTGTDANAAISAEALKTAAEEIGLQTLDSSVLCGRYYKQSVLDFPDAFLRPLNKTDLIGLSKSDLSLLRNQFYAVYGRQFERKDLADYFSEKPWYRARTPAGHFDDSCLSGVMRNNILFLKHAEETFDAEEAKRAAAEYASLNTSPYLDLLPKEGEIGVSLYDKANDSRDCGLYYEVYGTISVPVVISAEEMAAVSRGETIEVTTNELTGEKQYLRRSYHLAYGEYLFYSHPDEEKEYTHGCFASYNIYDDTYGFWENSADTVMKPVYAGAVYVLKGACEEYGPYFHMSDGPDALENNPSEMQFCRGAEGVNTWYNGNELVYDEKGYVKGLYYWGD